MAVKAGSARLSWSQDRCERLDSREAACSFHMGDLPSCHTCAGVISSAVAQKLLGAHLGCCKPDTETHSTTKSVQWVSGILVSLADIPQGAMEQDDILRSSSCMDPIYILHIRSWLGI